MEEEEWEEEERVEIERREGEDEEEEEEEEDGEEVEGSLGCRLRFCTEVPSQIDLLGKIIMPTKTMCYYYRLFNGFLAAFEH